LNGHCQVAPRIVLYLLETEHGSPVQFWSFQAMELIRIGRSLDNELIVANPRVSRAHAYLKWDAQGWSVASISEQGLMVGMHRFTSIELDEATVFRLGVHGPYLRFVPGPSLSDQSTMLGSAPQTPILVLDRDRLRREVVEIVEGDYFRRLQSSLDRIRERADRAKVAAGGD
jgi:pSer/pThr/pTyr-binding forkhead associated (FHA) protein